MQKRRLRSEGVQRYSERSQTAVEKQNTTPMEKSARKRTLFHLKTAICYAVFCTEWKATKNYKCNPFLFFGLCRIHRLPIRKADALQEDAGKLSRNRKNRLNRFRIVSRESVVASCRRAARSLPLPIIHDLLSFCKRFPAFSDFSAQVTKTRAPICLFSYTSTHHGLHDIRGIMYYPHIIQFLRDFL